MWVRFPPPALDSGRFSTFVLAEVAASASLLDVDVIPILDMVSSS